MQCGSGITSIGSRDSATISGGTIGGEIVILKLLGDGKGDDVDIETVHRVMTHPAVRSDDETLSRKSSLDPSTERLVFGAVGGRRTKGI